MRSEVAEGPLTLVFTDVEASTELRTTLGDAASEEVLLEHERLIRDQTTAHGGWVADTAGDGFLLAFESVRKAIACAIEIQRALERRNRQSNGHDLRVRIGINTGEVRRDGERVGGEAVHAAARVADKAKGNEILVSEVVRQLSGTVPGAVFEDRGRLRLKGFADRWHLYQVHWDPDVPNTDESSAKGADAQLPALVGRDREARRLFAAVDDLRSANGSVSLLIGDVGIGKTALAEEAARYAKDRRARVAWGNCWETVDTPPYWPWIQITRQLVGSVAPERLSDWPPAVVNGLHQLAPDVDLGTRATTASTARTSRFALFDAVWSFLALMTADQPLVLVLEDLHAADESSLHLLQFVAKQVKGSAVLILGSYDERELRRKPAQARLISEITRDAERVELDPLAEDSVNELYRRETGDTPSPAIAAAIARVSEGNPFFIREAIRSLTSKGTLNRPDYSVGFRVPNSVRDMVRARLAALAEESIEILGVTSTIGRRFDINLLAAVSELDVESVLDLLEQPLSFDILEESSVVGTYSFTHILMRETLYEDLTAAKRMRLHRRIAETLENLYGEDIDPVLPELAHHWFKAGHAGDLNKTLHYARRAAEQAANAQAHEEAVRLYQRALKASESTAVDRGLVRELKAALGNAREQAQTADLEEGSLLAPSAPSENSFVREGEYWTVSFEGRSSRLRDTKGLRYLAHLLANPGREIHVLDLVQAAGGGVASRGPAAAEELTSDAFTDVGDVLDAQAKAQYKRRLDDLRDEVEEAEEFNDVERAARARDEIEALVQQLAGAVGLGGRDRKAGSQAERARVNVTKTIKDALRRVGEADPSLGEHLSATVRTGTFCTYTPDTRVPIRWRV